MKWSPVLLSVFARLPKKFMFWLKVALPLAGGALAALTLAAFTLAWATSQIDQRSADRQADLAKVVLDQLRGQIAHDQESATVWDDAVTNVAIKTDLEWIDGNLGAWMHTYFGHDDLFILGPDNKALFAFADGKATEANRFETIRSQTLPLADQLRSILRDGNAPELGPRQLSPGVADFLFVGNRPAILSLKPITSDSGEIAQVPGNEYLHIAIRYLDGSLPGELSKTYLLEALRFSRLKPMDRDSVSYALHSNSGTTIGYYVWKPIAPGTEFLISIRPLLGAAVLVILGLVTSTILILRQRSIAAAKANARIHFLAHHDTLTGLPNRHSFECDLDLLLAGMDGPAARAGVVYLDLDRFKKVNDTLGHAAGDQVIRVAGQRIIAALGAHGTLYRIGGDEFMIIAPQVQASTLQDICTRIISSIGAAIPLDDNEVHIGISIGVALCPDHGRDRATLARKADVALYHAKALGRGRCAVFGHHMDALVADKALLEQDLRRALANGNEVEVYYQPKIDTGTGRIVSVEALARWHHPDRGLVSPEVFIAIAEDADLINALGRFVLEEACRAAVSWPINSIAVNISAVQLRDTAFPLHVLQILEQTGLPPHKLELEITESVWLDEDSDLDGKLAALRQMGVKIALDDFGTGFSSLSRLRNVAADRIKIDRSFVAGLGVSDGDEAIVRAIVDMGHAQGLTITAEGVETIAQRDFLRKIGCDELQGFLYSRALARNLFEDALGAMAPTPEPDLSGVTVPSPAATALG